jgi:hypothetical protein
MRDQSQIFRAPGIIFVKMNAVEVLMMDFSFIREALKIFNCPSLTSS